MLKRPRHARPVVSREAYTLTQIEKVFPGGEWVDEQTPDVDGLGLAPAAPSSITIIGGSNDALRQLLLERAPERVIVGTTITGRGGEREAAALAKELGLQVEIRTPDEDLFGTKASAVNVELVLCTDIDSPLVLVGNGQRVKEARAWLKRAKFPREVVEL